MGPWIVTGASGHLGNILVRAMCEAGHEVRAVVRRPTQVLRGIDCQLAVADVRDEDAVRAAFTGAQGVIHLAARISLHARDAEEVLATNWTGTKHVVAVCRAANLRLVHVSSIHAFDPSPVASAVNEDRPLATHARHFAYDRSKALGEAEVRAAIANGLDAIIVNPTAMLGPSDHGPSDMGGFFRALLDGGLPGLVGADFDWVDARDVADCLVRLAAGRAIGVRYILSGHRASLPELARQICGEAGVQAPQLVSPLWLAKATVPFVELWSRISKRPPLYTAAQLASLDHFRAIDGGRARRELGWNPRPLADTIRDTVEWWRTRT